MHTTPNLSWLKQSCPCFTHYYAVLDCAIDERIYPAINQSQCQSSSLFLHTTDKELLSVSPYVVLLKDNDFASWLFEESWGKSWGLFIGSNKPIADIVKHFRRIAKVRGPNNENWFFRYSDPRIIRDLLPTCDIHQLDLIMGNTGEWWMEGENPDHSVMFIRGHSWLKKQKIFFDRSEKNSISRIDPWNQLGYQHNINSKFNNRLIIRKDQNEVLERSVSKTFIKILVTELRKFYEKELQQYNDNQLTHLVANELELLKQLGTDACAACYRFAEMSVVLGWGFIHRNENKWMYQNYLNNTALGTFNERLKALHSSWRQEQKAVVSESSEVL